MPDIKPKTPDYVEFVRPDGLVEMRHVDYDTMLIRSEQPQQEPLISAEEMAAHYAQEYARQRERAYPSIADQLDMLYHGGYDAWRAQIEAVKTQFPKPEGAA